jgi:fatty-acyl-CoA synthase
MPLIGAFLAGLAAVLIVTPRSSVYYDAKTYVAVAPALGLAMAARVARNAPPQRDLQLRACIVGGDMFHPDTLRTVDEVLGPAGLGPRRLVPAYGLAEATLAVTVGSLATPPRIRSRPSEDEGSGDPVVSAGRALPGVEVRIDGDEEVGEILVRSPSLASGYFNDDEATAEAFDDGELRTGDLGFRRDDELYVVGRIDDVIKVGARKVWATELEAAVGLEPGVRSGNCAVVAIPGETGRLAALIEPEQESNRLEAVARDVGRRALEDGGVGISECVFLRRGSLPKTPSGKVQRFVLRERRAAELAGA